MKCNFDALELLPTREFLPVLIIIQHFLIFDADAVVIMSTANPPNQTSYNFTISSDSPGPRQDGFVDRFDVIFTIAFLPYLNTFADSNETSPFSPTIPLETQGCQFNGTINCAAACMDPRTLFSSTKTLYDCSALAIASILFQNESLTFERTSIETANHTMNFGDLETFNGSTITQSLADCLATTCQNSSLATCSKDTVEPLSYSQPTLDFTPDERLALLYRGVSHYCDDAGLGSDPDIAGPGVTVSYIIQCAIVLFAFVVFKGARIIEKLRGSSEHRSIKPIVSFRYTAQEDMDAQPQPQPQVRGDTMSTREEVRIYRPLGSIMADFQETQAILVVTIQVATLVYFNANALVGAVDTFGEAIAKLDVIRRLAFDGMMPVLLGQVILQRARRHWWYTTFLTTLVFSLGLACNSVTSELDYAALWDQFKDSTPVEACGGNPSPATYCFARASGSDNLFGGEVSSHGFLSESPLSWTRYWAIAFILIDQILAWLPYTPIGEHLSFTGVKSTSWSVRLFWYLPWFILQILLFISVTVYVLVLYEVFLIYAGGPDQWSFGQFIAVMVWVPLGAKLLYSIFFGVEKGVENRVQQDHKKEGAVKSQTPS